MALSWYENIKFSKINIFKVKFFYLGTLTQWESRSVNVLNDKL